LEIGADALRRLEQAHAALEKVEDVQTIEAVAAGVGWSADHLRRVFRAVAGTSPQKVQMAARLRLARELLRAGNIPIAEIALQCGFPDASHFARAFKSEHGLTPREWQSLARKT
jgi:AraC family transcriptional regulator